MFYKKLTRKTKKDSKTLRYKLLFWNIMYGGCDAPITHKLDYVPEQWIVFGFSSLHNSLVYDKQSLFQPLYQDISRLTLRISNMSWDYDQEFPAMERNIALVQREHLRVKLLAKNVAYPECTSNKIIFKLGCPFYNIYLATNTVLVKRW